MQEINVTLFETLPDGKELGHPIMVPGYLLPAVGDEVYLAKQTPLVMLKITGKRIVVLPEGQFHVAYTAKRVE